VQANAEIPGLGVSVEKQGALSPSFVTPLFSWAPRHSESTMESDAPVLPE
jgi:hypothetical protein